MANRLRCVAENPSRFDSRPAMRDRVPLLHAPCATPQFLHAAQTNVQKTFASEFHSLISAGVKPVAFSRYLLLLLRHEAGPFLRRLYHYRVPLASSRSNHNDGGGGGRATNGTTSGSGSSADRPAAGNSGDGGSAQAAAGMRGARGARADDAPQSRVDREAVDLTDAEQFPQLGGKAEGGAGVGGGGKSAEARLAVGEKEVHTETRTVRASGGSGSGDERERGSSMMMRDNSMKGSIHTVGGDGSSDGGSDGDAFRGGCDARTLSMPREDVGTAAVGRANAANGNDSLRMSDAAMNANERAGWSRVATVYAFVVTHRATLVPEHSLATEITLLAHLLNAVPADGYDGSAGSGGYDRDDAGGQVSETASQAQAQAQAQASSRALSALGHSARCCHTFAALAVADLTQPLLRHGGARLVRALMQHPILIAEQPMCVHELRSGLDVLYQTFLTSGLSFGAGSAATTAMAMEFEPLDGDAKVLASRHQFRSQALSQLYRTREDARDSFLNLLHRWRTARRVEE